MRDAHTGVLTTNSGGDVVLRRVTVRVVSGDSRGAERTLEQGTMVIGSHPDADLCITDHTVSRFHAELGLLTDGVRVRDLGSTNGTFVNRAKVTTATAVRRGDLVQIGHTVMELG